jgi:coproporphyrinogen III oxidase-like Fe-S oxidoreductase
MLRLRTVRGLDLGAFAADFGVRLEDRHAATLDALAREGLAVIEPALLRLTPAGLARADGIAARLAL